MAYTGYSSSISIGDSILFVKSYTVSVHVLWSVHSYGNYSKGILLSMSIDDLTSQMRQLGPMLMVDIDMRPLFVSSFSSTVFHHSNNGSSYSSLTPDRFSYIARLLRL